MDELGNFLTSGFFVIPITLAIVLVSGQAVPKWRKYLSLLVVLVVIGGIAFFSFFFAFAGTYGLGFLSEPDMPVSIALGFLYLALVTFAIFAVPFGLLLPGVRKKTARIIPIDPSSFLHALGLFIITEITLLMLFPLVVTNGVPPFALNLLNDGDTTAVMTFAEIFSSETYSLFWILLGSFLAVGLYSHRSFPEACSRLGLTRPTLRTVTLGLGTGLLFCLLFTVIDSGIIQVFTQLHLPVTDEQMYHQLFADYLSPPAALVGSISAGLGEETAVRGVLQPRYGILASSLLFAALHAFQYSWDGVLSCLLAGIAFGVLRNFTSTTTSALSHGTYDFTLFISEIYHLPLGSI